MDRNTFDENEKKQRYDLDENVKKPKHNPLNVVIIVLSIVIILFVILSNIQLYLILNNLNIINPTFLNNNVDIPKNNNDANNILSEESKYKQLDLQLENRITIDDFLEPTLWNGDQIEIDELSKIQLSSQGDMTEIYRKFDGFLELKNYLFYDIEVKNLENIEWIAVFLMEDLSYTNYYECNLIPFLSNGDNKVIINKKDFLIGTGKPEWDKISTVKVCFETIDNTASTITIDEISTYDASPMCSIWFDDGWASSYTQAFPIMKERNFKGISSIVSSYVNYPAYCSDSQLDEMYEFGWDFVNHTHTHQNLTELEPEEAEREITTCLDYLITNGYTRACHNVVQPYCETNESIDSIISNYAITSRPTWDAYNYLPIIDPYNLSFREVTSDTTPQMVFEWINEAIENDLWLVLLFHSIESPADMIDKYEAEDFKEIIEHLYEKKSEITVVTLSEVLDSEIIEKDEQTQIDTKSTTYNQDEWTLVWEDNFNQTTLDESSWNALNAAPFKNNELQTYRENNITVKDGYLNIISSKENDSYFSGAITTDNKKLFQYGKIEIKAKLPEGKGIFPAIWMLTQSGAVLPEIDIIEFLGNSPDEIWHVLHFQNDDKKDRSYKVVKGDIFNDDFHIFTLDWTEDSLTWLIDGVETYSISEHIPSQKMYLYLNTAIGGNWPGDPGISTEFPQTMLIDYVKYYTRK